LFSLDHDIAAEIEHLTTSMDGSDETVVAGLAFPPFFSHFLILGEVFSDHGIHGGLFFTFAPSGKIEHSM